MQFKFGTTSRETGGIFVPIFKKQNYKCLASTTVSGDGIYAEYTYNGDKQELYEDVYQKLTNTRYTEE